MSGNRVNLAEKFDLFSEHWSPKIVGDLNNHLVKLVRFQGDFLWHQHENEDEMFLVVKGRFTMRYRDRDVEVREGEFVIVPRGTEHMPVAPEECWVMLIEPATTRNTGNVQGERTRERLDRI